MTREELMELGLTEEQADKVLGKYVNMIPKHRFDEVNESKKQLEKDIASRDAQLETLKNSTGDIEGLKKQITNLQEQNRTDKANYEAQVKKMQLDSAVERALTAAKAKNLTATKALLASFLEKAELEGETVKGLDEEVKKLVEGEDTKFLFDTEASSSKPKFTGIKPGEKSDGAPGGATPTSLADAVKMHFESKE